MIMKQKLIIILKILNKKMNKSKDLYNYNKMNCYNNNNLKIQIKKKKLIKKLKMKNKRHNFN